MIEKHTFVSLINMLKGYWEKVHALEGLFEVYFDQNWLTTVFDRTIESLQDGFFTDKELEETKHSKDDTIELQQGTIEELLMHYCVTAEFGANKEVLDGIYVATNIKDKSDEIVMSAFTPEELYDLIIHYISHPDYNVTIDLP